MKIAAAQLDLHSSHQQTVAYQQSESLRFWVGQAPTTAANEAAAITEGAPVTLSREGSQQAAQPVKYPDSFSVRTDCTPVPSGEDSLSSDATPQLSLLRTLLEHLFGQKIELFDPAKLTAADTASPDQPSPSSTTAATPDTNAGWGLAYDYHERYSESESTHFTASGKVQTSDGRQIDFTLAVTMERQFVEENHVRLRLGDAARMQDPLVLNFDGTAAQLSDWRFDFDLNADGTAESIPFVTAGKGLLAFDRNGNGEIDDGSELFGPSTGNGFSELAALDQDGNGWIDENDNAFNSLRIWSKSSAEQEQLQTLAERQVGALSLAQVDTPFALRNQQNQSLGELRNSGLFLQEDGKAGTMQQVDIAV